jgi:hypothetical protein
MKRRKAEVQGTWWPQRAGDKRELPGNRIVRLTSIEQKKPRMEHAITLR